VEAQLAQKIEGNRIRYEVDFDAFAKAAQNSSIFLLCNPHNPIGHIYSRAELKRMAEICIENDVVIVSDEIHSELLLGTAKFTPMATLSREIANRTITLIAASKTFNIPGLHCAFAIIPNRKLRERYQATAFKMGMEVASPGLVAARVAFSGKCDSWLRNLRHYLTNNRDFIVDYVTEYMPSIRATIPDATYLAWLDITQTGIKDSPHEFFLKNGKVALSNGANFGKGGEGHVRLNFGTSRKLLEQGLERMRKALRSI
jgi:cystathionine beta-lyase